MFLRVRGPNLQKPLWALFAWKSGRAQVYFYYCVAQKVGGGLGPPGPLGNYGPELKFGSFQKCKIQSCSLKGFRITACQSWCKSHMTYLLERPFWTASYACKIARLCWWWVGSIKSDFTSKGHKQNILWWGRVKKGLISSDVIYGRPLTSQRYRVLNYLECLRN